MENRIELTKIKILSLEDIRKIYLDNDLELLDEAQNSLKWHLDHSDFFDTIEVISYIASKNNSINVIVPYVLEYFFNSHDDSVRQRVVLCILFDMQLVDFLPIFLAFFNTESKYETHTNTKENIIFCLGFLINKMEENNLSRNICAELLLEQIKNPKLENYRYYAYRAILACLEEPKLSIPIYRFDPIKDIDLRLIEKFSRTYLGFGYNL